MQAAAPEGASLLQLPTELLRNIWQQLEPSDGTQPADQHALRCTCRAVRDASNSWFTSIRILPGCLLPVDPEEHQEPHGSRALSQLSRFPRAALLHHLSWNCRFQADGDEEDELSDDAYQLLAMHQARDLLPAFLWRAQDRLSSLLAFTFSGENFGFGDAAALADTCSQLQVLQICLTDMTGPVFAPLQRLRSLASLSLWGVCALPHQQDLVLSSLSMLTGLTKLCVAPDFEEQHGPQVAIASPSVLPCLANLCNLRDLNIGIIAEDEEAAGALLAQHISGLQHLTCLKAWGCLFPYTCPALACTPNLARLDLPAQTLDTPLIRLLSGMPRLKTVTVGALKPDRDLSQLPCSWEVVIVDESTRLVLQQLLRLPRGLRT